MNERTAEQSPKADKRVIWRPWITTRDGRRIYARAYGKKAFRIEVDQ